MIGQRYLLQHLLSNPEDYHKYVADRDKYFPIIEYQKAVAEDAIISLLRSQPYISTDPFCRKVLIQCVKNNNYNMLPFYIDHIRVSEDDCHLLVNLLCYALYHSYNNISDIIIMHITKWKLAGLVPSHIHTNNMCITKFRNHMTSSSSIGLGAKDECQDDNITIRKKCIDGLYYLLRRIPIYKDNVDEIEKVGDDMLYEFAYSTFVNQGSHI